jgi:hypothetical protein
MVLPICPQVNVIEYQPAQYERTGRVHNELLGRVGLVKTLQQEQEIDQI